MDDDDLKRNSEFEWIDFYRLLAAWGIVQPMIGRVSCSHIFPYILFQVYNTA